MKTDSAYIEWDVRFQIGIPLIDKQHERLVLLTNNLHLACRQSKETANQFFMKTVHEAVNYVKYHFTTEEKMMLLFEFPDYVNHRKEHQIFIKEVLTQTAKFSTQKHLVPNRFVQFLKEWILSHIALCDRTMAEYILSLEYNEKLQLLFLKLA